MVVEPWLIKMGNQVSNNLKNSLNFHQNSTKKKYPSPKNLKNPKKKQILGIISFEVANIMCKLVHLHNSISDHEISKLVNEVIKLEGVRKLVSCDESYLIELAFVERLDDLNRISEVVSRLGKKCVEPHLLGFEHVYDDIKNGKIEVKELGFLVKDMEGMIRKFERYVGATSSLYGELEVLNELEQSSKKFLHQSNVESRNVFEQKVVWQRHDVRHLKDVSLWNRSYDKVVELLARMVCTLFARLSLVFGNANVGLKRSHSTSVVSVSRLLVEDHSHNGALVKAKSCKSNNMLLLRSSTTTLGVQLGFQNGRIFKECLSFTTSASKVDDKDTCSSLSDQNRSLSRPQIDVPNDPSRFGKKTLLSTHTTPSTIGGSALALHYANVIIVIEKFLLYPHLVGEEARDDLYQMLPSTLRRSLRIKLKSRPNNFGIFDGALAHDWKETLDGILKWLAPLAHNMIRWQSERNVEQQQIVSRTNVLLLQTLYFADKCKTESAICQLLVGLNFICRYEQQQNALLDCASSFDFGDWMEWQLQCRNSYLN